MSLPDKVFSLPSFKRQLRQITIDSCSSSFHNLSTTNSNREPIDWSNLLTCASMLGNSSKHDHLEAALRIAHTCLENKDLSTAHKTAAGVILDSLTNQPAIKLAIKRHLLKSDFTEDIPLPLLFDVTKRRVEHTIFLKESEIYLNAFQKDAFDKFSSADVVSVSAPTSAGKSFILYHALMSFISSRSRPTRIVYIVPTRALISQVEKDFQTILSSQKISDVLVTSVPKLDAVDFEKNLICVFTQERLHWLMVNHPNVSFNYMIVDEAQKIAEGSRGIFLQQKIEEVMRLMPDIKVIFSSPLTRNPEILLQDLEVGKKKAPVNTEYVAVNQNLIYVSQRPKATRIWNLELCLQNERIDLGSVELESRPLSDLKKVALIASRLASKDSGNIIYMNKPAYAEKVSNILFALTNEDYSENQEIKSLIELSRKSIHRNFLLNKVLTKGIAFHYGNMPLLVREQIENLFERGIIKYLICTSTLLEGVNLPAKNIFLRKPTKGAGHPLNDTEFWNLAGRAGRLGKEFQGNIICIDPDSWDSIPDIDHKKQDVVKALDQISSKMQTLLAYLNSDEIEKGKTNSTLEWAFAYYYSKYRKNELDNSQVLAQLKPFFDGLSSRIDLPDEILFRNPGISPAAQQNLLEHFRSKADAIDKYIPDYPESENAVSNSYVTIMGIINRFLSGDSEKRNFYQALLVVNWMRGYPLPALIDKNYEYEYKKNPKKSLDSVIRETMRDVEEFARFKFAKYSSCYIDILRFFLQQSGQENKANEIPNLSIWLELGVSQQTQVSLIALGLSRQTSITLSEFIADDNLDKEDCIQWLRKNDIHSLQLSNIMIIEIKSHIEL
ncbi:DEAD/DEAH box helicase [Fulvivirgaceae bacterium PWU4]|uniref:DEAD/DEAH box helicase n=1 Tax=Chryseosolibacter histidini TaxID=2782349 RepID=A0AAP2DIY5_9BACT|nr:DEAD/DEAH box helicase [Chryseosolibacter histidini]MBT1696077.1 DEAD/DEAH box helicase [Chryseosolibacter histidini]